MTELMAVATDEKGKNWWPFLKAKHFLVDKYKNHPGSGWTDGDPLEFYKEFGPTVITIGLCRS